MADFETVVVETDLLISGGGMAGCGAAVEASYWAKKHGLKVTLVDKKQIWRTFDAQGAMGGDIIALRQEAMPEGTPLLQPVLANETGMPGCSVCMIVLILSQSATRSEGPPD